MNEHYQQWSDLMPRGMILIGAGASIVAWAATLRASGKPFWAWLFAGLLGLIVLNTGVAFFGDAVKHRALYENKLGL